MFISEVIIVIGAFREHRYLCVVLFLTALTIVAAGAGRIVMSMSFGETDEPLKSGESMLRVLPSYVLLLASIGLCVWMPDIVYTTILNSIKVIGGGFNG